MSTQRILPFDRIQASAETARFDVTSEKVCPTCGQDMVIATANGHRVWVCERDRHCFPLKDEE